MDSKEIKNIVKILSIAYLYRKTDTFPITDDVETELKRREKWLESVSKKIKGRAGYNATLKEIWMDPLEDFLV